MKLIIKIVKREKLSKGEVTWREKFHDRGRSHKNCKSYIKEVEDTRRHKWRHEGTKREILFLALSYYFDLVWLNFLTWFTSLIWWLLSLVCHQCQRGRLLISDWNKLIVNKEIVELRNVIVECSFNHCFVTDVKPAYCRQDICLSDLSNIT